MDRFGTQTFCSPNCLVNVDSCGEFVSLTALDAQFIKDLGSPFDM